jgi:hypothetical protein
MGIEPHIDLWNYFPVPGYGRAWMRKRWCGAVLISLSGLGQESIYTSTFQCLTHRPNGGK